MLTFRKGPMEENFNLKYNIKYRLSYYTVLSRRTVAVVLADSL